VQCYATLVELPSFPTRRSSDLAVTVACLAVAICAIITIGTTTLVGHDALISGGAIQVLAALTIPLVPALGVSLLVSFIDRYERRSEEHTSELQSLAYLVCRLLL